MNNTRYFLRKKHMSDIERELTERLNLSLCFKSKRESIYKNSELMVTCKKNMSQYLFLMIEIKVSFLILKIFFGEGKGSNE